MSFRSRRSFLIMRNSRSGRSSRPGSLMRMSGGTSTRSGPGGPGCCWTERTGTRWRSRVPSLQATLPVYLTTLTLLSPCLPQFQCPAARPPLPPSTALLMGQIGHTLHLHLPQTKLPPPGPRGPLPPPGPLPTPQRTGWWKRSDSTCTTGRCSQERCSNMESSSPIRLFVWPMTAGWNIQRQIKLGKG